MEHDDQPRPLRVVRALAALVWRASPPLVLALAGLTVVVGVVPVATIWVGAMLLDRIVGRLPSAGPDAAVPADIVLLLVITGVVLLLGQLAALVRHVVEGLFQQRVANRVSLLITEKAGSLDLAFFENPVFYNKLTNASNEASFRPVIMVGQAMAIGSALVSVITAGIVVAFWQPWMLPLLAITATLSFTVSARFARRRAIMVTNRASLLVKSHYLSGILTTDLAAKEVRSYRLDGFFLDRYRRLLDQVYAQDRGLARWQVLATGAVQAVLSVVRPLLLVFIVAQVLRGTLSVGQYVLYAQSIGQLESSLLQVMTSASQLYEGHLFVTNLFAFLALRPAVEAVRGSGAPVPIPALAPVPALSGRAPLIEFDHVGFTYPDSPVPAMDDLSLVIRPGEVLALVGENGAGKSTLVKLLLGLYRPDRGRILVDGIDTATMPPDELRARMSVLFQDYMIYHLSAYENVALGDVARIDERDRVIGAAQLSGLDRIVDRFPNGYDSILGRYTERGHELSGGQRQMVGLARSLVRQAPILIFDEPTAALDINNEARFFRHVLDECRAQGQTVLFISHRFSTVRRADRILVLEHGRLVEDGPHETLLALDGRYAGMYRRESDLYQEPAATS